MHITKRYMNGKSFLSLLPLAMRMAGPREALWHALIRKNYGCTHFLIGRDHAGPGKDSNGNGFYDPYEAQYLLKTYKDELGIEIIPSQELVYAEQSGRYIPENEVRPDQTIKRISATEIRERLEKGVEIPEWLSFPEVVEEVRRIRPPRHKRGFTVFFTGLSGAGKSTIANALRIKLMQTTGRSITFLDGDVVRKHLSSELGFSREHRDLNILRIGFVAGEVARHGGVSICAPIAPYAHTRQKVREMVSAWGGFIEVYVSTPLETCEARDRKGLYAKARAGIVKEFTGISDPYESPKNPEITIDTTLFTPDEASEQILTFLKSEGYIR
jgi:sulfate adenylyltransferase